MNVTLLGTRDQLRIALGLVAFLNAIVLGDVADDAVSRHMPS